MEERNMIHYGDVQKIDGSKVPKVDVITFGAPCFAAGTLITTNRGLVPIEEVNPGDMVFTHNKRFMTVKDSGCTGVKPVFDLYGMGCNKITVTENHPFYARKMMRVYNNELRRKQRSFDNPEWVKLKDLSKDYYLGMPINNNSENLLDLTSEELYLMGRYVADGYIRNTPRKDRPSNLHAVIFCIGKNKHSDFVSKITSYKYYSQENRTSYKVRIANKRLEYLCESCGKGAINKCVPSFVLNLPVELLQEFMRGYMEGDGCFVNNYYSITTISEKLAYGLVQIVGKLYHRPCRLNLFHRPKTTVIEGRVVNQHDTYTIHFTKDVRERDHAFYEDGYIWFPIRRIERAGEQEVYNLSVEEDESYCANNATVHNCQDLSVAGGRAGMKSLLNGDEEETRSGLFFEAIRIIKEMREDDRCNGRSGINIRPRFAVYENVTGAYSSGHPKGADFQAVLQEICKIVCKDCPPISIPKEGWHYSGNLDGVGDDGTPFSISWRTHDAQYWGKTIRDSDTGDVIALGTPQRRRRISVVADFGGTSASKVQFEQYSECGNTEESESEGQGVTRTSQEDIGETSETLSFQERAGCAGGGKGILIQRERTGSLLQSNAQAVLQP